MAAVLVSCTVLVRRNWRLVFVLFLVRMWRRNAAPRLMLPLPRTLKRFAAPFFVFILGMTGSFFLSFHMTPGGPQCGLLKPRLSLVSRFRFKRRRVLLQPAFLPFPSSAFPS